MAFSATALSNSTGIFSLDDFQHWWMGEAGEMRYDNHPDYRDWLQRTCENALDVVETQAANNSVPLWQMSASTDATSGWRDVLPAALPEKVRQLSFEHAWNKAPEDILLLFKFSSLGGDGAKESEFAAYGYIHGHHRACASHAMMAFYYASPDSLDVPFWLAKMASNAPATVDSNVKSHLEIVSRGMARTLKHQHGTTTISWCDVVVVIRKSCKDTEPEER